MDQNQDRHRGNRPRRGSDRRGPARRPSSPQQTHDRPGRDQVDVEQIMRDIRGRIAQRQGIDLSNQQIQDLAARRLESILDPRAIKPSLLDGLRRGAAAPTGVADKIPNEPTFSFEDTTIYDSHRGALRFVRRLLNPLLKLLFNPNPLIRALHLQANLNVETAERNAERDRRQTEWNALHFEIVQRLVTEVSRVSLELQALSMRVEALGARVDFNDRRVGHLEGSAHRARPQGRPEPTVASPAVEMDVVPSEPIGTSGGDAQTSEVARRRRRRRRGRRSGSVPGEYSPAGVQGSGTTAVVTPASGEALAADSPVDGAPEESSEMADVPGSLPAVQPDERHAAPVPSTPDTPASQIPMSLSDAERGED